MIHFKIRIVQNDTYQLPLTEGLVTNYIDIKKFIPDCYFTIRTRAMSSLYPSNENIVKFLTKNELNLFPMVKLLLKLIARIT